MRNRNVKGKIKNFLLGTAFVAFMVLGSIQEPPPADVEETEDIIHWKDEEMVEHETEITFEEIEVETVTEPTEEEVIFYDVPLSEELQMHIFEECEKHNIAPNLVIALIERECRFVIDAVSPHGAEGPMQVMSKWHWDRMERLGCDDLSDPYQNITVGIDYLGELKDKNNDIVWVLMAYRWGGNEATEYLDNGIFPEYAISILERSSELAKEVEDAR